MTCFIAQIQAIAYCTCDLTTASKWHESSPETGVIDEQLFGGLKVDSRETGEDGDFFTGCLHLRSSGKLKEPRSTEEDEGRRVGGQLGAHRADGPLSSARLFCTEEEFMWRGRRPSEASGTTAAQI